MRLDEYLKHRGISQAEFAREVGLSDQSICDYLAGRRALSDVNAARIEKATGGMVTFVELKHPDFAPKFRKAAGGEE